jgi:hypothetical protein
MAPTNCNITVIMQNCASKQISSNDNGTLPKLAVPWLVKLPKILL